MRALLIHALLMATFFAAGENGNLRFTQLSVTKELFRAALGVLEGAFRFTTDIASRREGETLTYVVRIRQLPSRA